MKSQAPKAVTTKSSKPQNAPKRKHAELTLENLKEIVGGVTVVEHCDFSPVQD